jgi:methylmalonyl-CoA epimerase
LRYAWPMAHHLLMRVDHVSIAVRSIDAALEFFRRCLPIEMRRDRRAGYTDDFNWCDFYIGDFKLELIEATRPGSFVERFITRRGEGLHHLSLEVPDLEAAVGPMARDGLRIVDRFDGGNGEQTAFLSPRSAHGVLIQFWQVRDMRAPQRPRVVPWTLRDGSTVRFCVDHVSIAVRDIDTALALFRRYFPIDRIGGTHSGYDGSFNLTTFALNGYRIELIEEGQRPGFVSRFLERRGEGFHHISIDVDRLDPLIAQLEGEGVRIVDKLDIGNGWKTAFISPRSAHGVLIQFWQDPTLPVD